jgi:nitric oxide reductase activation protein
MEGEELDYESPQPVESRGDFKPELVQLLSKLRKDKSKPQEDSETAVSIQDIQSALQKSAEIKQDESVDSAGAFKLPDDLLANLMKELAAAQEGDGQQQNADNSPGSDQQTTGDSGAGDDGELAIQPTYSYYDEWDFRAGDYKPHWCRVIESPLSEGTAQSFDTTLRRYAALATQTRRQFEILKPELFRKIKPLLDGEEFDLDAVIEYLVERRAGQLPPGKVYWRRNKVERDVAVAFLLDMSASTDEEISRQDRLHTTSHLKDIGDPKRYFTWWMDRRAQDLLSQPKRIIDIEKESIVLLINALETIGDTYGIYGFSGYGRENVEFYVVKDLAEPFNERIKRRIDKIAPVRSTRMGPAIRHAITKLEKAECRVRILFLVSDGRPQDHGYGRDRTEKEYAIHDTHMALLEARHKGIVPFAMTVDRYGHDYLKEMCEDIGYAVVPDIESLPSRITTLYRRLTE